MRVEVVDQFGSLHTVEKVTEVKELKDGRLFLYALESLTQVPAGYHNLRIEADKCKEVKK